MRGPENIPNGPPSQDNKILKGRYGRLQEIEQTSFLMNPMLPYKCCFSIGSGALATLRFYSVIEPV